MSNRHSTVRNPASGRGRVRMYRTVLICPELVEPVVGEHKQYVNSVLFIGTRPDPYVGEEWDWERCTEPRFGRNGGVPRHFYPQFYPC